MQGFGSPYPSAFTRMPVTKFDMNLIVAGLANRHEVAFGIGSAPVDRNDVMDFLNWRYSSFFQAAFAKGMIPYIPVPDSLPLTPVLPVVVWRTLIRVVFLCSLSLMLLTIGSIGKVRTAWILAWLHWLMWHIHLSPFDFKHEKSPLGSLQMD